MKRLLLATAAITFVAFAAAVPARVNAQTLDSFGVLGGSTVTNTGSTIIFGNVGVSTGSAITGLGTTPSPGIVFGSLHSNDAVAIAAQAELVNRISVLSGMAPTDNLTGQDLGGMTLTPGVYVFDDIAQLTGPLTLNGLGDPNAVFVFLIGDTLTTASASSVVLIGGAQGTNISWVVGSSATLGTTTDFAGRILASASITLTTGATIECGSAWAHTAAVTLDTNAITGVCAFSAFGGVLGPTATENELAVAAALDDFVTGGGTLPAAFQALLALLAGLTPEEQAAAFAQLSGETATGVAPSATRAMDTFLSQLFDSAFADDVAGPEQPAPGPGTVKTLSYAPEDGPPGTRAPFATFDAKTGRSVWASAYGSHGTTAGDALVGSNDRFDHAFGFAAGYSYRVAPDFRMGVAFGVGSSTYTLADNFGSGRNDTVQVSLYGRKSFGDAYLAAALAYAFNGVSTSRFAAAPISETFTAEVGAHNVAAQVETGIRYGWLTPYAALRLQAFYTPAYSEATASGPPSPFALAYEASTAFAARMELGARIAGAIPLHQGASLGLHARAAWAHDFSSTSSIVASFQGLPGAPFAVQGAKAAGDSFLISAGADIAFRNGFSIGGSFDGDFSATSQNYGGKGRVRYVW